MKSAEEVYKELKAQHDFITYEELAYLAMKEFATLAIDEQLKVAAEEAELSVSGFMDEPADIEVDKESILNCTRVDLK